MWRGNEGERGMNEELRFHLEMQTEQNLRAGMTPEQARREALKKFGGIERVKEECRETSRWHWLETFWQDVRYGVRMLAKSPGFTTVALLSLALGIGVNTAIFSLIDVVMMKMLPVHNPEELVVFELRQPDGKEWRGSYWNYDQFRHLARHQGVLKGLAAHTLGQFCALETGGQVERAFLEVVTGNFFSVLGVHAYIGRTLREEDDREGAPVAMLSYGFWSRRFGRDPAIVGRTIRLNGQPFTVVGVIAPGFYVRTGALPEVYIPIQASRLILEPERFKGAEWTWLRPVGRREGGRATQSLETPLDAILQDWMHANISSQKAVLRVLDGSRGRRQMEKLIGPQLLLLMAFSAVVLLIACANIANLLLARSTARGREIALRMSLGAGRVRLLRQLLTESVLLGVTGGFLGLAFLVASFRLLVSSVNDGQPFLQLQLDPDGRVAAFTAAISLAATIAFGLLPALKTSRLDLGAALKEENTATAGRGRWFPLRQWNLIGQVALSLALLGVAAFVTRSLRSLESLDRRIFSQGILLASFELDSKTYRTPQTAVLVRRMVEAAGALPGVRAVSIASQPFPKGWNSYEFQVPESGTRSMLNVNVATPGFFETMGIPLAEGRDFDWRDESRRLVCVLNESAARACFGSTSIMGRRLQMFRNGPFLEVVGVSRDVVAPRHEHDRPSTGRSPTDGSITILYRPDLGWGGPLRILLRANGDPAALTPALRRTVADLNRSLPLYDIQTIQQFMDRELFRNTRLLVNLISFFGVLALLLAAIGIFGVISYSAARRTHELGIRLALGSSKPRVVWLIVRDTLSITALGVALGIPLAIAGCRLTQQFAGTSSAIDQVAFASAIGILVTTAVLASLLPALRAARIAPMEALRHE